MPEPFAKDVIPRMEAIGERLNQLSADIIAFQEIWTSAARDCLVRAGIRAGFIHRWHTSDTLGGSGLLVLSRLPILESQFEPFALRGSPEQLDNGEYLSGKGFVRLRIQGPTGTFSLLNTHLHARYNSRASHQFTPVRIGQIVQLAAHASDCEEPLLMVGDLNAKEDAPEIAVLSGLTGMRDSAADLDQRSHTILSHNPYRIDTQVDRRIDYVFYRSGVGQHVEPLRAVPAFDDLFELNGRSVTYSNHAGVMASFEIVDRAESMTRQLNRKVVGLASKILASGRREAELRREHNRMLSGTGLACAVVAATCGRSEVVSRRGFLHRALQGAALVSLTPGVGYSMLSEFSIPDELDAFDKAVASLDRIAESIEVPEFIVADSSAVPS